MPENQSTEKLLTALRRDVSGDSYRHVKIAAANEIERLRSFIRQIADAPDSMVCSLTREAAKEVLS